MDNQHLDNGLALAPADPKLSADDELSQVREALSRERGLMEGEGEQAIGGGIDLPDVEDLLNNAFSKLNLDEGLSATLEDDFDDDLELDSSDEFKADMQSNDDGEEDSVNQSDVDDFDVGVESKDAQKIGVDSGQEHTSKMDDVLELAHDNVDNFRPVNGINSQSALDEMRAIPQSAQYLAPDQQQIRVGLLEGLGMLGGAGLAGLTRMMQSGSAKINTQVQARQYKKVSAEIDTITNNMDGLLTELKANGLASGIDGLEGENRLEFIKEFLEQPVNKALFNDLLKSIGALTTKATHAAVLGAGAGLSSDQLDIEISKRVHDVQEKHKQILENLTDHNGTSLSDRLNSIAEAIANAIQMLFQRATQALGLGPRPGM